MLATVFENFRNMCRKIHELDPARFLIDAGLAWQAALKKTEAELELLANNDMLLMVQKGIRGGICDSIYWYICYSIYRHAKANNWDVSNIYGWVLENNFE